ncbi:MAG: hypothetical protein GX649_04235 [Chloroflexi bacterium]|nr:hypothetical protein [Chloroflexota bacterium]
MVALNRQKTHLLAICLCMAVAGLIPVMWGQTVMAQGGLQISETEGSTTVVEGGSADTYTVSLGAEPTAPVTVTATPSSVRVDLGNGPGEAVEHEFSVGTWNEPWQLSVTAPDNDVADGPEQVLVQHVAAGGGYDGAALDVPVSVQDDDAVVSGPIDDQETLGPASSNDPDHDPSTLFLPEVIVSPVQRPVVEGGSSVSYTMVLGTAPLPGGSVTITATAPSPRIRLNGGGGTVTRIFTGANWNVPQSIAVQAVDNDVADGIETVAVSHTAKGGGYDGVVIEPLTVTVHDNDRAGVNITPQTLQVTEGNTTSYDVVLSSQPPAGESVAVFATTASERLAFVGAASARQAELAFTSSDWNQPQTVTVQAVQNNLVEGTQTATIAHTVSGDGYEDVPVPSVTVTIADDDTAGVTVSPSQISVAEGGPPEPYTLVLTSQPTDDVTITARLQSPEAVLVGAAPDGTVTRTFTTQDWDIPQSIAVEAVDDVLLDGHTTVTITHTVAATNEYQGVSVAPVVVSVSDNDTPDVRINPLVLTLEEGGAPQAYTLALTARPDATVSIDVSPDGVLDVGNGPGQTTRLSIPPAEWQTPRTVTVTAVDNDVADGIRGAWIAHTATGGGYSGIDLESVRVVIADDDVPGIVLSATELVVMADEPAELTITLATRPSAWVRIPLSVIGGACRVLPSPVDLGPSTWREGVTVAVQAADSDAGTGDGECTIQVGPALSVDPGYDGLSAPNVRVALRRERGRWIALPLLLLRWPPAPGGPTLLPIENPDGDGDYEVAWSPVEETEAYLIEEATGPTFSDASVVYEGPEPRVVITGRGAGRRWYRARSRSIWGVVGPWSAAVHADVWWEQEPNDAALQEANGPLVADIAYRGRADSADDPQDYYYLELTEPAALDLRLTGIPDGHNSDLVLRDAALTLVAYSGELGAADEQIITGVLSPGRYYVQVYHRSYGGQSEPYTLVFSAP